jgi:hypothetical protein
LNARSKDIDINHKLTVFARRVKELRQSLSDRFEDFEILPLVVTALSVARISSSDREKAQAEGIGIVAAEQLQDLVAMARRGETEEQVWAFLEPLIPSPSFPFGRVSPQD